MKPFEVGKTYKTDAGESVRILAVDAKGPYPIVGLRQSNDGDEYAETWKADGVYLGKVGNRLNLIPEKDTRTVWLNVYPDQCGDCVYGYRNQGEANDCAGVNRIACIPVTFEMP